MKTQEQFQAAINEIKDVCHKHGVLLVGTCSPESIYGEIAVLDATRPESWGWLGVQDQVTNTVTAEEGASRIQYFYVSGIGTIDD